jgi:hypothetical protein
MAGNLTGGIPPPSSLEDVEQVRRVNTNPFAWLTVLTAGAPSVSTWIATTNSADRQTASRTPELL